MFVLSTSCVWVAGDMRSSTAEEQEAFAAKREALHARISSRHLQVAREVQALEDLDRQLAAAAGPQKETVENLRTSLELVSGDVEAARVRFDEARKAQSLADSKIKELTELKEALSERLIQILENNESAKIKKLDELHQQLDQMPATNTLSASTCAHSRAEAPPRRRVDSPSEETFAGFDEPAIASVAGEVSSSTGGT